MAMPAVAKADTTDLALVCDRCIGHAVMALGVAFTRQTGVRIDVFPTPSGLILPQLAREVQNDVVISLASRVAEGQARGLVLPAPMAGPWRNPLVLAIRRGRGTATARRVAASDVTPGGAVDGVGLLARLNLHPEAVIGTHDGGEAAGLLAAGRADMALLHLSEVRADPHLAVARVVGTDIAPAPVFSACLSALTRRPHPEAFLAFLASSPAGRMLAAHGLETVA
ncbi:MAG: substrate-binding domain-containing protein [Rhodospirillales bacterium]|nr:substrate-binding domain-containing protein [Rhodospirillales bacterium]MDE2574148.1 substrate-binding domain-containing protein [Rhodospirillales bacterium]